MDVNTSVEAVRLVGRSLVDGQASGELLWSNVSLSFWGGVDSRTGVIVDQHHPLQGQCVTDRIVAIPAGRGSCSGSGVLLELLLRKMGPTAFVFQTFDEILTLGVVVAKAIFQLSIPVVVLRAEDFSTLQDQEHLTIIGASLFRGLCPLRPQLPSQTNIAQTNIKLSGKDDMMLSGANGKATQIAMEILLTMASLQGAEALLNVTQVHIDACIYTGPGGLEFAQKLLGMGGRFSVPTTLNSISIDSRKWKELDMDPEMANQAQKLADTYMNMGALMSFTCAPYLLDTAPKAGENIGWAESNAVVFANSVLGAKTQKYPDFLDVCIALTGRAPMAGCHIEQNRLPVLEILVPKVSQPDDAFWPLIGYLAGKLSGPKIPLIFGLEHAQPTMSDLKAFGAAFATTASAAMFHIVGVTPEAQSAAALRGSIPSATIQLLDVKECWAKLNTASDFSVSLVSLGNPHFSLEEFAQLASLCSERKKHHHVHMTITTSRATLEQAEKTGHLRAIQDFGAQVITDTCWCMLGEPIIPEDARNIMTNSAKYAHYAPGMVNRGVFFGSLAACVEAACTGQNIMQSPGWLLGE
ncbi:hypothetical protein LTR84_002701 [Exophiala bonariae]|uniref:Aconitase X catalytic domain-containing protein n=1 Tax=Exophiala bonariae TaxID=1690606 RepID=A0AAV9N8M9_9EURO|nr:hypothetical protein LTR84_002701 [Exophiala bonariae]